ncbi:M20 aminoacylase family protein [Suttonella ornithocola]|uniref:Uncharacterized hydrolase YxeP n=1 Tax=Suttonella ornithocola TaxID=279832 RepID=A0A380MX81_9GAMM|nr:M20 aminoacylase family protein [Suttonella ornithocola]SUO96888.1 Uncharacterized hydrolase YxeP [Suttonella ornithocola]
MSKLIKAIQAHDEIDTLMRQLRQDFHAHPETAYQEHRTAKIVAQSLKSWGIETHCGLAVTGVVGVLKGNQPGKTIGIRADMDALEITEANDFPYCSTIKGKMHACGHDGHTAILLGTAKYLSEHRNFAGTVIFIFQPAEENECGGGRMIAEGLFEQFPVDAVYALHNWPDLSPHTIAVHDKAVMASFDLFDIILKGKGCHGAQPHQGNDVILAAAQLTTALQSIISRNIDPSEQAVLSVTQIHGGDMYNILPATVTLSGGTRAFTPAIRNQLEARLREITTHTAAAFGVTASIDYQRRYPPTINHPEHATYIRTLAQNLFGDKAVEYDPKASNAAEDFAIMLEHKPGAYFWLGNGRQHPDGALHNPHYNFNDDILATGANLWIALVQQNS